MIRILINVLDDEAIWIELIQRLFTDYENCEVSGYKNSQEFFAHFDKSVDLVIMDVRLKDGTDVTDRINRIYETSENCYIIVVSAYLDIPILQELMRLRVNDTVVKADGWLERLKMAVDRCYPKLKERAFLMAKYK